MKTNKTENLIWFIFIVLGLVFIGLGIVIGFFVFNYDHKIETTGIITEITTHRDQSGDTDYTVYVSYQVDQKEYESPLNSYSSSFYEGQEITIYYDESNPSKIGVKSLDLLFLLFPGFGLIFFTIGGVGILVKKRKIAKEKYLKSHGEKVVARYVETVINKMYRVNGSHPYNIICSWDNPVDHKKYIFKSQNLWLDPVELIREKNIDTFPVYIDRKNIKKYVVDVDILIDDVVDLR